MAVSTDHTVVLRWNVPDAELETPVKEDARQMLASECPYSFYFRDVQMDFDDGILLLRGRVPSFYLKQILQTWLAKVDGVRRIDNQVDVASSTGLSSVRPK
jgi:hypothetical protein